LKILTRYILKEMLGPTVLGFLFYTSLILMRQLFDLAGMIISRSLAPGIVAKLLLLSLPNIVVLTVPMSLLFGILIAIGRLSTDSEIIAIRALGISTSTIYLPVFLFSFAVFLINLYLMNVVLPRGNSEFTKLRAEIFTSTVEKEVQPRRFYDDYENLMIYVNDIESKTGEWKGVFVADTRGEEPSSSSTPLTPQQLAERAARERQEQQRDAGAASLTPGGGQRIVIAQTGNLAVLRGPSQVQVWMNLRNAATHVMDPRRPDRYDLNRNAVQRILLPDKYSVQDVAGQYAKSLREMDLRELLRQEQMLSNVTSKKSATEIERQTYNLARVEIHKKFAIPFACIAFGILGLPLGITNRRGGKSSGFSLSIGIILFYYVMINNGEALARSGRITPAIGMWAPNVILLIIGIYLLRRANRDAGAQKRETGWMKRAMSALARRRQERKVTRHDARRDTAVEADEPSILKRLDITFPNILDRYILREFVKVLTLVIISTATLFVVVDYTGIASDIRENHIPLHMVLSYYRFSFFYILNWTLPISVLVATLVTFGMLSRNNEVTAFKSSGVSLYRAAVPVIAVAGAIALLAYLNLDFVLPYANQRVAQIGNRIKGHKVVRAASQQRTWFVGKGRYIINFLSYDSVTRQVGQIQVYEFHPTEFRITRRVYANRAKWDGRGWVFSDGWIRSFTDDGSTTYTPIVNPIRLYYQETPQEFALEGNNDPSQMTFGQLRRYIESLQKTGYAADRLSVQLYSKTSWPFLSLIMALIALPFAFRIGKRGALYGVGIALVVGIFYWMVYAIFTKFGEVGNLPPILSAWSANILFAIAAVYLFLHAET
jgi:LPS export ABC transporter permease LptG